MEAGIRLPALSTIRIMLFQFQVTGHKSPRTDYTLSIGQIIICCSLNAVLHCDQAASVSLTLIPQLPEVWQLSDLSAALCS